MISKAKLDTKTSAGQVGSPKHTSGTLQASGSYQKNPKGLNITASSEDKGAKWERPRMQDAHPLAKNQYMKSGAK